MLDIFGTTDFEKDLIRVYDKVSQVVSFPKKVNVNLTFISKDEIRELNRETRGIDKVTDVLTYPYVDLTVGKKLKISDYKANIDLESGLLTIGDIYICINRAKEQAKEYGHSLKREFCFLALHGFLHLLGYDHIIKEDEEEMFALQNKIMELGELKRE